MEDDLHFLINGRRPQFSVNRRRPQFLFVNGIWLQICLQMEDNLNLFVNDRKFVKGRLSELAGCD